MVAQKESPALPGYLNAFKALASLSHVPPVRPAGTVEVDPQIYLDEERCRRERTILFRKFPLILAHESELAEPGAVIAHDYTGVPILLARGRDRRIRAFLNACRHRNTKLVNAGVSEKRATIVCPYHAWTYGLDGKLLNIPCEELFPGVDKAERGLVPLPCEVRHGLVWVTPTPTAAIDLDASLAGLGDDLDAFGVQSSVIFRKAERVKRSNWKLIVDAFQDGYHIHHLHRHSIAPFFKENSSIAERVGNHIRSVVARNPTEEARRLPPEAWDIRQHASYAYYLFPNAVLIMHPDYISVLTLYPQGPGETLFSHIMLTPRTPQSGTERAHYERSFELIDQGVFEAEDLDVCERAQAALEGGAVWPMSLGALEIGISMFHAILEEALSA